MNEQEQRTQEIQEIAITIRRLSERLETLLTLEERAQEPQEPQQETNRPEQGPQVEEHQPAAEQQAGNGNDPIVNGDYVEIVNNYRNLRGTRGTVVNTTPTWIDLRAEGTDRVYRRRRVNVRRVVREEQ